MLDVASDLSEPGFAGMTPHLVTLSREGLGGQTMSGISS